MASQLESIEDNFHYSQQRYRVTHLRPGHTIMRITRVSCDSHDHVARPLMFSTHLFWTSINLLA